jgi:hypothetical protein
MATGSRSLSSRRSSRLRPEFFLALALVALIAGCGGGSTHPPAAARIETVCTQAGKQLQKIDRHDLRAAGPKLEGELIEHAAAESLKLDASTSRKLHDLPPDRQRSTALSNIARSETELRAILHIVRSSPGIAYGDLPSGTVLRFLRSNRGCGIAGLHRLIIK